MKTFSIITFGCRTNQAESRMIGEQLSNETMIQCHNVSTADIVIINACSVTHKAEKEVNQYIRRVKRENPKCLLIVTGCFVHKEDRIMNHELRIMDKTKIIEFIKKEFNNRAIKQYNNLTYKDQYFRSNKAVVKIQDGCNNFCTYCIVPYLRGRSVSRSINEIIKEIKGLETRGVKEVILTGVDIADYKNLVGLLDSILRKTGIKTISFGSINIDAFTPEFIDLNKNNSRITRHFHIPLQSGCDAILKRMKRKYTVSDFVFRILNLKKEIPEFTFSNDIIVGFPGETDEEFEEGIRGIKGIRGVITKLHVFRYSPRSGTVAAKMEEQWGRVDFQTAKKRAKIIANLGLSKIDSAVKI